MSHPVSLSTTQKKCLPLSSAGWDESDDATTEDWLAPYPHTQGFLRTSVYGFSSNPSKKSSSSSSQCPPAGFSGSVSGARHRKRPGTMQNGRVSGFGLIHLSLYLCVSLDIMYTKPPLYESPFIDKSLLPLLLSFFLILSSLPKEYNIL